MRLTACAQRTAHSAQRTAHSAQRTAHSAQPITLRRVVLALITAGVVSPAPYAFAADYTATDEASYKAAITAANASTDPENVLTIVSGSKIELQAHPLNLSKHLALIGELDSDGKRPEFDGQGLYTGLRATSFDARIALENLTFSNHKNENVSGGGVVWARQIDGIENSRFLNNHTQRAGGAVSASDFVGDLARTEFDNNTVNSIGESNLTAARGGALRVQNFVGDIVDASFINNRVISDDETQTQQGGAAYFINMTGNIINTTFDKNRLEGAIAGTKMGGALHVTTMRGNIAQSVFTNNDATIDGSFSPNDPASRSLGGAVNLFTLYGDIDGSRFENNTASHAGGAVHILDHYKDDSKTDFGAIKNSEFIGNRSQWGGAVSYHSTNLAVGTGKVRLIDNHFVGNQAVAQGDTFNSQNTPPPTGTSQSYYNGAYGGAVYIQNHDGEFEFINNVFVDNSAISTRTSNNHGGYGGAIALLASKTDVNAKFLATSGGTTIFYGNRHNMGDATDTTGVANSIYFGNNNSAGSNRTANASFHVDAGSQLLMLDPMASQPDNSQMYDTNGVLQSVPNLTTVIEKTGAGEWVLGGANEMKGASEWKVNEGTITLATVDYGASQGEVQGSISLSHDDSSFTLGKDAVLGGTGTVAADTVTIDGTIAPSVWKTSATPDQVATAVQAAISGGGSAADVADAVNNVVSNVQDTTQSGDYGVIEIVSDDVTFGADSKLVANISNDGDSDVLKVTGTGSGNAKVTIEDGAEVIITSDEAITWEVGKDYAILEIDEDVELVGDFDVDLNVNLGQQDAPTLLTPTTVVTAQGVQLVMEKDEEAFKDVAQASGQAGMGDALLALPDDHAVTTAIVNVKGGKAVVSQAFDNLSGEIHSSTHAVLMSNTNLRNVMGARLQGRINGAFNLASMEPVLLASNGTAPISAGMLRPSKTQLWANTWGFKGRVNSTGSAAKVDSSGMGLAVGADIGDGGVMVAFEDSKVKNGSFRNSRSDVNAFSLGGYLGTQVGDINLRGGVAYSYLDVSSARNIWVSGLEGQLKADYKGHKVQAFAEVSKDVELNTVTVSPYAGITQVWLRTQDAQERGTGNAASAALSIKGKTDAVTLATVGVRAAVQLNTVQPVALYGDLGWQRAFGDKNAQTTNRFANTSAQYSAQGVGVGKNRALIGAGVQAQLSSKAVFNLGYQGQFGSGSRDHSANLQVKVRF